MSLSAESVGRSVGLQSLEDSCIEIGRLRTSSVTLNNYLKVENPDRATETMISFRGHEVGI